MKALSDVRAFFDSHNISPCFTQPQPATALKHIKILLMGLSIQYPSDWTINETNSQPSGSSAFDIVTFYPILRV
jgi:hypothetical protein